MTANQSWVTYSSDDHDALKALILVRSLKRVITRRSSIVFLSHNVSEDIGSLLEDEFDRCIRLPEKKCQRFSSIPFGMIALVHTWNLTRLDKFVFLDCNCVVAKNSDELFKTIGVCLVDGKRNLDNRIPLIADRPSISIFNKLVLQFTAEGNNNNEKKEHWTFDEYPVLENKYNIGMNLRGRPLTLNINDINILQYVDFHPIEIFTNHIDEEYNGSEAGLLEKEAVSLFFDLFATDELPAKISELFEVHPSVIKNCMKHLEDKISAPALNLRSFEKLKDSVAIVGMSFRFPGANNVNEFWDILINGKDGIIKVPDERWTDKHCFGKAENCKETRAGFLKCPIDEIDGKFFGLSPAELSYMDPQHRLTLQVTWEALEHSGINPVSLKNSNTGVFGGLWRNDYKEMMQDTLDEESFFRIYMGNSIGNLAGRVSHVLDTTGPSIATESGCSTSIVSVDQACKSLLNEDCDLGLAFGVNLFLFPFSVKAMNSVVAQDGHCKTFDEKADGFGRAEGCAVLVLKRFPDAVRDGDRVWGVIRGSAVVQEGPSRSMGTPTKICEARAMELALEDAGIQPKDVGFIETHGTGTPVGDPLEVAAMAKVYSKDRTDILTIGSVKTNIGHTESCSGIAGIIKTLLTLQNEIIPPHRNFEKLNPEIDLDAIPARIPLVACEWKKNPNGQPRIAGVSSFGITGTDAHVIIQETPDFLQPALTLRRIEPFNILKLSAKSQESLDDLLQLYKEFLSDTEEVIQDICITSNVGRGDFQHRCAFTGHDTSEILQNITKNSIEMKQTPASAPKICFLFTGQGSQYHGMGKTLYDHCPTFQMHFDSCDRLLTKEFGINMKEALWGKDSTELSRTIYSQTSIFCIEYCLLKLWESWGVKPDAVLGHSLGEFAAAVAAGILTFEDALTLVAERSLLIDGLPRGKMLVIKETHQNVTMLLKNGFEGTDKWLDFAAVNSPDQTVLAGSEENIQEFSQFCKKNNIKTHILDATHAFHSRQMDLIRTEYLKVASSISYLPQTCTFISGMEGIKMEDGKVDAQYWVDHCRKAVLFMEASKTVLEEGCNLFLEVGPHPVLSALTMINSDVYSTPEPIICLPSLRKNEDGWSTTLSTLGKLYVNGVDIKWDNVHQFSGGKKVTLPFYPFQNKSHWFESNDDRLRPIHALVGTPLSSPSSLKIFQNHIDLSRISFLKDHAIGTKIIYPGAGFLEMCLVSGHAALQCSEGNFFIPNSPLTIEDFLIEGPLGLTEDEKTQVQTIVSSEDSGETRVTIYSKMSLDKETHKWIRHASGLFLPYAVKVDETGFKNTTLDDIKSRCQEKLFTDKSYEEILKVGLKFGPAFQTMRNAWKGEGEFYCEIAVTQSSKGYICHPVIIDAMFQAMVFLNGTEIKSLHVPISVSKFIWYAKIETDVCYVYGIRGEGLASEEQTAVLYDSNGQKLAMMIGATMIATTVSTITSTLEAQRTSLPTTYEEVWRDKLGTLEKRVPNLTIGGIVFSDEFKDSSKKYNFLVGEERVSYDKANQLYLLFMIKALYDLGWTPEIGQTFHFKELLLSLNVKEKHMGLFRHLLMELSNEGFLKILDWKRDIMTFEVLKQPPSKPEVESLIETVYLSCTGNIKVEVDAVSVIGRVLGSILSGQVDPLPLLFPETVTGDQAGPAETVYKRSELALGFRRLAEHTIPHALEGLVIHANKVTVKPVFRILEVGAGTGAGTENLLRSIPGHPSLYEYTYTDISPAFLLKGEKIFETSKIKAIFKTLNIELDPMAQGFTPHHYDLIFASEVIHATRDIKESLINLRNLLSPSGILVLAESVIAYRGVNITFGVLEGFWRFTDYDLRPYHCEMESEKWEKVMRELNFCETITHKTYNSHCGTIFARASPDFAYLPCLQLQQVKTNTWILFDESEFGLHLTKKLKEMGRNVITVKRTAEKYQRLSDFSFQIRSDALTDMELLFHTIITQDQMKVEGVIYLWGMNYCSSDYVSICQPYLYLCKSLLSVPKLKLFVISKGLLSIGDHDVSLPSASPLLGMTKALSNENDFFVGCKCVDIDPDNLSIDEEVQEVVAELFKDDGEFQVAYRGHRRNVCRFVPRKFSNNALSFPKSKRFHLILPSSNSIADLKFSSAQKHILQDTDVEIRVKAYALNFRDLLIVLKPSSEFDNWNCIGFDYSGIVTAVGPNVTLHKVGDPVFGINFKGDALPSHIKADEGLIVPIPDRMTFADASTLPAVAATTYLCLLKVADLKEGETILIHTASGGVGLCAIQFAKALNCNIIATAGSHRKRAFLRNLGIKHVFHSRNTNFEKQIRQSLNGEGVDVVLNSLTGPGFKEASLSVCKSGARFIEMSVLNTWSKEEVKVLRPDVVYEMVDLSTSSEAHLKEYMGHLKGFIDSSSLNPIPYVRFDASEIREALTFMQKAKHIGKIVCIMPEPNINRIENSESQIPMFNDRSSYLITGGLGGIGMEVAKWMTSSGAKHIVLVGRSPPNTQVEEEIKNLNSKGGNVICMKCDIGDYNGCRQLLESLKSKNLPPLRGIMHAAGVLADASYANQTWEQYEKVYNPKVRGGWNLHELTLDYHLEHFVMFSSVVANMGSVGQSNHSSANVFLDSLAFYRHSIGLPATTINWGQWGQVGVAANLEVAGLRPFTPLQGVSALERIMKSQQLQATVLEADLRTLRTVNPSGRNYLQELKDESDDKVSKLNVSSEDFWAAYDNAENSEKKYEAVKKFIHTVIRHILKFDKDEVVEDDSNFQDIGMDSLMMIEMKNALQSALGTRTKITLNSVKDCTTVAQLSSRIVELVSGVEELAPPTKIELNQLIRDDAELPSEIRPQGEACKPSDIRTILITGVSGNLGPYVLREISRRPNVQKIYCLMRPHATLTAQERLLKNLADKNLSADIRLEILESVIGNVTENKFGLPVKTFTQLANEVDAVFHLAVKSNHVDIYQKARESDTDMRTVNVLGTKNVLQFACASKSKHVFHASSTLAVSKIDEDGRVAENWPNVGDFDNLPNMGYPISKFISDLLIAQAVERGLPCKVFRFPFIGGESKTGRNISALNSALMLRMMAYLHLGIMPSANIPFMMLPVDMCAEISSRIFFDNDTGNEAYNVHNPFVSSDHDLIKISGEFGYSIEVVKNDEFFERVGKMENNELLHFIKRTSEDRSTWEEMEENVPEVVLAWVMNRPNVFLSKKLEQIIPEYPNFMESSIQLLKRDLQFAKTSGVFSKLGLKM